jgi:hypothetical protein
MQNGITFDWKVSYQNEVEYVVYGHPTVKRIEKYSVCKFGLLEYQFRDFNGMPEEFRRTMRARQGGVKIEYVDTPYTNTANYWNERRWSEDLYHAFTHWLLQQHAAYIQEHAQRCASKGYSIEEYPLMEMHPLPRPIFYNPETQAYETEPWFNAGGAQ